MCPGGVPLGRFEMTVVSPGGGVPAAMKLAEPPAAGLQDFLSPG